MNTKIVTNNYLAKSNLTFKSSTSAVSMISYGLNVLSDIDKCLMLQHGTKLLDDSAALHAVICSTAKNHWF